MCSPKRHVHSWRCSKAHLVLGSCVVSGTGCFEPFPKGVSQFHSCAYGAALSIKTGEERVSVEGAIPDGWELVGIPAGDVMASELVAAGLASELADMLLRGDDKDARWCVTRAVPYDPSKGGKQTTAESSCTECR